MPSQVGKGQSRAALACLADSVWRTLAETQNGRRGRYLCNIPQSDLTSESASQCGGKGHTVYTTVSELNS